MQGRDTGDLWITFGPGVVRSRVCFYDNPSLTAKAARCWWFLDVPKPKTASQTKSRWDLTRRPTDLRIMLQCKLRCSLQANPNNVIKGRGM